MATVGEIRDALLKAVPESMKYEWDNVGLLCGRHDTEVTKVLLALDPTPDTLEEAKEVGAQLVVTHHPLIFEALKNVTDESYAGRNLLFLIENGIAAINLHTNLDCAPGGVNEILARTLGLADIEVLEPRGTDEQGRPWGLLRAGTVPFATLPDFAALVKRKLACPGLRYADANRPVHHVAVGGGSCGSELETAIKAGCDTFVTADLKYHQFAEARYRGINLIDAGHFETENPVCARLREILSAAFPGLALLQSKNHGDETQYLVTAE
jgi:dinuclear metal center YbgI/SA1388 family protein